MHCNWTWEGGGGVKHELVQTTPMELAPSMLPPFQDVLDVFF